MNRETRRYSEFRGRRMGGKKIVHYSLGIAYIRAMILSKLTPPEKSVVSKIKESFGTSFMGAGD